ncbi:MAG: PAS domain S-box protein [Bacteroidetes bacterium]|nr:PAS domain S-box protein [Bacteroidota bacterium]
MDLKKFTSWFKKSGEDTVALAERENAEAVKFELMAQMSALHNSALVSETDLQGNITFANDKFVEISRYRWEELIGQNHRILKSGHQPDELFTRLWHTISTGNLWQGEIKNKAKDGSYYWVAATLTPILDELTGKPVKYIAVRFDITRQKALEEELHQHVEELHSHEEELRQTLEELSATNEELGTTQVELMGQVNALNNAAIVSETNLAGNITFANDTFCHIARYSREELMGQNHRILKSGLQPDQVFVDMWKTISEGRFFQGEVANKAKDGSIYWVVATVTPVLGPKGYPVKYISVRFDITRQKEQEQHLLEARAQQEKLYADLEAAKEMIEHQLKDKNDELQDSIIYSRRIQRAIMPRPEQLRELTPAGLDVGVLFRPLDQVSGDFYWVGKWKNKTVVAVGDSTGHGVPGAFLSIIGITTLHKLVDERGMTDPASILDELDQEMRYTLDQHSTDQDTIQDSIEMSLVTINEGTNTVNYAAAMRYAHIVSATGDVTEIPADRRPIGGTLHPDVIFKNQQLELNSGDTLYLFSDGFIDQFGGPAAPARKFGRKAFRELLQQVAPLEATDQVTALNTALDEWKGFFNRQTDDIVIMVIKAR